MHRPATAGCQPGAAAAGTWPAPHQVDTHVPESRPSHYAPTPAAAHAGGGAAGDAAHAALPPQQASAALPRPGAAVACIKSLPRGTHGPAPGGVRSPHSHNAHQAGIDLKPRRRSTVPVSLPPPALPVPPHLIMIHPRGRGTTRLPPAGPCPPGQPQGAERADEGAPQRSTQRNNRRAGNCRRPGRVSSLVVGWALDELRSEWPSEMTGGKVGWGLSRVQA